MKRFLFLLLVVVVLFGYLGTVIDRDPGYVLITYRDYSLQTSFWIMLGLIAAFSAGVYCLLRLWRLFMRSGSMVQGWRADRAETRANELSQKGFTLLAEGEFERARKFLDSGIKGDSSDGINYLAAARAANDAGDDESRETYLRLAEESDSKLGRARSVVTAELALMRGDPEGALIALESVKSNPHVAFLTRRALLKKGDWREILKRLPELKKAGAAEGLEREAAIRGLSYWKDDNGALNELFKSLSADTRQDTSVISAYTLNLSDRAHAEPVLRAAIKKSWQSELLALYGMADDATLVYRIKQADKWLRQHPDDAALHYCLGCLHLAAGDHNLAKQFLGRSQALGFDANAKLAEAHAALGEFQRAYEVSR
ncbi:MAG: hypothetical protein JJ921_12990 [Pseudomonadales bacterium]|nr:hypothetical protein [Pseudomonadales bacterium]MBO6703245.1 hypothetical protein [Pseudomonadales bacterium]MBO7006055.1 hypothetical protein [Pseudomonadales bacterium]